MAAELLNDQVIPFFKEQDVRPLRILTDRGTEYCGNRESHEYQLYPAIEDTENTRTCVKRPQSNGICERFLKTLKDEFYSIAFRKKLYTSLDELQADLDAWLHYFKTERPHTGRHSYGKTPMATFEDAKPLAKEKELDLQYLTPGVPDNHQRLSGQV